MYANPPPFPSPYVPRRRVWPWVVGGVLVVGGLTAGGIYLARRSTPTGVAVWLYSVQPVIAGAGPWKVLLAYKGATDAPTPPQGWRFEEQPGDYLTASAAEEAAQRMIRERGGTPERLG